MTADVAARIEANVSHLLLAMGAAGGGVERDDEVRWTVGGSPIGYHNAVVACDVDDANRAAAIARAWREELRARDLPGSWHLSPSMRPATLDALLRDAGFDDGGEEPAMAADLTTIPTLGPTDLVIAQVDDESRLRAYRDVLASGFGEGPIEADWATSVFATLGLRPPWHHYVGTIDGTAVATTTLLLTGDVGGIWFVCTHPDHRRRGYGAAITRHAMAAAGAAGATHAVLGSSPMGQRVYERLGFETVFAYRLFETP